MFRPRLSLLTALLLMTIVALAIGVIQLWREVGPLRAEVRSLRDEVGYLAVDDKSKFHAIRVNTNDELHWKWRVWVPNGKVAVVHCTDRVSPNQFSSGSGQITLQTHGENVVEFRIEKDRRDDSWSGTLKAAGGSIGKFDQPWVGWSGTNTTSSGVGGKSESFEPGKRIELTRCVVTESAQAGKPKPKSIPSGMEIWIETK